MHIPKQDNLSIINWLFFLWSALVPHISIRMRLAGRLQIVWKPNQQGGKKNHLKIRVKG